MGIRRLGAPPEALRGFAGVSGSASGSLPRRADQPSRFPLAGLGQASRAEPAYVRRFVGQPLTAMNQRVSGSAMS